MYFCLFMETISFIGSGNVATHLAQAFFAQGHRIAGICSRNLEHAHRLAALVNAVATNDVKELEKADIYIIAVNDTVIEDIAKSMPNTSGLVLHTAGTVPMGVLQRFENNGVLYPLQSLHRDHDVNIESIPFFIEANIQKNLDIVRKLASSLSDNVRAANSATRAQLHLSAVFACNFVNALLAEAATIAGADFDVLQPLVQATVERAFAAGHPAEAQTGPARRGDMLTMEKHLQLLAKRPELQELYKLLSERINNQLRITNYEL